MKYVSRGRRSLSDISARHTIWIVWMANPSLPLRTLNVGKWDQCIPITRGCGWKTLKQSGDTAMLLANFFQKNNVREVRPVHTGGGGEQHAVSWMGETRKG